MKKLKKLSVFLLMIWCFIVGNVSAMQEDQEIDTSKQDNTIVNAEDLINQYGPIKTAIMLAKLRSIRLLPSARATNFDRLNEFRSKMGLDPLPNPENIKEAIEQSQEGEE